MLRKIVNKHKKNGRVLVVTSKRINGCYFINKNKDYHSLLDELQVRLIALDVLENEEQDLTVILDTEYADKIIEHNKHLIKVMRCKMIKV